LKQKRNKLWKEICIPRVIEAENKRKIATGYNKLDRERRELKGCKKIQYIICTCLMLSLALELCLKLADKQIE
jgi:nitrogen fixation/metabolism regulation signal transduction histidine kinase